MSMKQKVKKFDQGDFVTLDSPFAQTIGVSGTDASSNQVLGEVYDQILNAYGGDTSQAAFNQAAAADLASITPESEFDYGLGMFAQDDAGLFTDILGTAADTAGSVLKTDIPGLFDVPFVGPILQRVFGSVQAAVNAGAGAVAQTIEDTVGGVIGGNKKIIFNDDGTINVDVTWGNQPPPGPQKDVEVLGTSKSNTGSTTVGTNVLNLPPWITGADLEDYVFTGPGGEVTQAGIDALLEAICSSRGGNYNPSTGVCEGVQTSTGGQTTQTKETKEDEDTSSTSVGVSRGVDCTDPVNILTDPRCRKILTGEDSTEGDGEKVICPDGSVEDSLDDCPKTPEPPKKDCTDPVYAAENPEECKKEPPPLDCNDPVYAAENPEECKKEPPPDPCDNPAYAAENPELCGGQPPPPPLDCTDPVYAAENPEECKNPPPPPPDSCDNPAYAAENPEECGGPPPPPPLDCTDPVYAAENPEECARENPCDNPAYAAENPEECGTVTDLCLDPEFAKAFPDICGEELAIPSSVSGSRRRISREQVGTAEIPYIYDITTGQYIPLRPTTTAAKGGKIAKTDLVDELSKLIGD